MTEPDLKCTKTPEGVEVLTVTHNGEQIIQRHLLTGESSWLPELIQKILDINQEDGQDDEGGSR